MGKRKVNVKSKRAQASYQSISAEQRYKFHYGRQNARCVSPADEGKVSYSRGFVDAWNRRFDSNAGRAYRNGHEKGMKAYREYRTKNGYSVKEWSSNEIIISIHTPREGGDCKYKRIFGENQPTFA